MKIGFLHLGTRVDTWAKYYLWTLRRDYPQHEVIILGEEIGHKQFRLSNQKCDVYLHIDDGLNYAIPDDLRPMIYVCSDSHMNDGINRKLFAAKADYSFCCQKSAVGEFGREWLPHAAYYFPELDKTAPKAIEFNVSSVMMLNAQNAFFATRTQLAQAVKDNFDKVFIETGPVHEKMAEIYSRSYVVWNYCINEDINMRLFEAAAAGCAIISNRLHNNKVEDIFGDLVVLYDGKADMLDKLHKMLANKSECIQRGEALRQLVAAKSGGHSYSSRVKRILEVAAQLTGKQ